MSGAVYLCPLLGADDGDGGIVAPTNRSRVMEVFIHPSDISRASSEESAASTALLLASFQSELVPRSEMARGVSRDVMEKLPEWAQTIMRTGCFEPATTTHTPQKRTNPESNTREPDAVTRKRPRAFEKKDHLRIVANGDGDVEMQESQEKDDPEDGSLRSTFTQQERDAGHVGKYTEAIEGLLEGVRRRRDESHTSVEAEATDVFTEADVKLLLQSIKLMEKSSLIIKCEPEFLLSLLSATDLQVQVGLSLDVFGSPSLAEGEDNQPTPEIDLSVMGRVQFSLDVVICELLVMSTAEIDRRVLSEEAIDNCMQLLTNTIQKLILPCIDPSSSATILAPSSNDATATSTAAKKGANTRSFSVKHNKKVKKAIDRLLPVVCESMELLARLITTVKLCERWILHFSSLMTNLFAIEFGTQAQRLQRNSLIVLRSIFLSHPAHRNLILDDVVTVIQKLPTAKRNLRTVKLAGSATHVQMITTLVVSLVQAPSSVTVVSTAASKAPTRDPPSHPPRVVMDMEDEDEDPIIVDQDAIERLQQSSESARVFVAVFLRECMKKTEERDNRVVIENLVEDFLSMFGRPEWAGAELLLESFSTSLAGILGSNLSKDSKKLESQHSLTALNLVGRICASIKMSQNMATTTSFDDEESHAIYEEHEAYLRDWLAAASGSSEDDTPRIERELVLKHMVVTYIRRSLQDVIFEDSKNLLLTRFLTEEPARKGYAKHIPEIWRSYWQANASAAVIDSSSKLAPPQLELALRASRQIAVARDFCNLFDTLMKHLMALLSKGIPTFRARVMKALSGIVDVDPMLMAESGVRATVCRCFLDEATSVRQAAVDLVGKYVALQPLLFDQYFEMLCDRLRDKGISVRKSVCKIFRAYLMIPITNENGELILTDEQLQRRSSCMRNLVERIGDVTEEEIVKNFIIDTFQETWFGSELSSRQLSELDSFEEGDPTSPRTSIDNHGAPPGWSVVEHDDEDDDDEDDSRKRSKRKAPKQSTEFISPDGKAFASAEEAWAAYRKPQVTPSSVVKKKRAKTDDTQGTVSTIIEVIQDMASMDWFVALLKRLLQDDTGKAATGARRISRDRADEVSIALARSEKIVACLIECLVRIEEGKGVRGVTVTDPDTQFLSCVKALNAFSEASPSLLSPHLEVIMVYLKGDDKFSKATEAKVQGLVVGMVANVIAHTERVTERVARMLESDLKNLVFRAPPSVVGPSIKCLATLTTFTRRPPTILFKMLETFFAYLVKFQQLESLASIKPDASSSLQRALFTAGQIAGSLDLDTCAFDLPVPSDPSVQLAKGSIMESLYQVYSSYLRVPGNPACTAKAIQGLGFLFMLRPRFLLQTQQDGLFDVLLKSSAQEVRLQLLASLKELLQHEEQRLEKGAARSKKPAKDKSKTKQVQGDQDGEASLIGGVMQAQLQNILPLSLEKHVRIRSEAVACIAVLLTQGLVSPLHCIPTLVALEADQIVSIRDTAHAQLLALHEKFPTLVHQPSIHGIFLSHSFQLKAFGKCTVFALDKDKKEYCLFGRLYSNCLRPSRTQRSMFLRALVNQFSDKGTVLTPANLESSKNALRIVDYLSYLAQLITALPYDVEDEPLFIIYLINRYVTLKLGPTLQELKKEFKAIGVDAIDTKQDEFNLGELDIAPYVARGGYDSDRMNSLLGRCCVAFAINLLLRIKFYLKELYGLDNEKCQTYQPGAATKATDQHVTVTEFAPPPMQLPSTDDLSKIKSPLELTWTLLLHTWRAAQEDLSQLDFEAQEETGRGGKKKKVTRRRKAVVKVAQEDEDEDEFVEGFDG